ncbi:MAG TPA: ATP cone domain-containing protein, partial [Spirochaetia bacterium]|nr:ATP cone domain-containing protein [Spirochaetales bacterium]HRW24649.1 ATP cone domain-containing protein [Spirochaetia bacterium]
MAETQQVFPEWRSFLKTEDGQGRYVAKRSGSVERYDRSRIESAIEKAFKAVKGVADKDLVQRIAADVESRLAMLLSGRHPNSIPAIEEIQDLVETALIDAKEAQVARAYIL